MNREEMTAHVMRLAPAYETELNGAALWRVSVDEAVADAFKSYSDSDAHRRLEYAEQRAIMKVRQRLGLE